MNILVFEFSAAYILKDVMETFREMGHATTICKENLQQNCYEDDVCEQRLKNNIKKGKFDFVFTVNYYPILSRACYQANILYVSWQYDSPPNLSRNDTLEYSTNRIFFFSKYDLVFYQQLGIEHVYYLPLAANWRRFLSVQANDSMYGADVALVGKLYPSILPELMSIMSEEQKIYLDTVIQKQLRVHGAEIIDLSVTDAFAEQVCKHYRTLSDKAIQPSKPELFYACCTQVTRLERLLLLRLASKVGRTALYAPPLEESEKSALVDIEMRGTVDYLSEMPSVFKSTKINLNPTLRANRTAIPLRALDIMACSAFMLTSAQDEYEDFFVRNKEYVAYDTLEEAVDLMRFYLTHDSKREEIAVASFQKVQNQFNYSDRIKTIVEKL